jgi:hypothetical protein
MFVEKVTIAAPGTKVCTLFRTLAFFFVADSQRVPHLGQGGRHLLNSSLASLLLNYACAG